jgi:hypothetical protein
LDCTRKRPKAKAKENLTAESAEDAERAQKILKRFFGMRLYYLKTSAVSACSAVKFCLSFFPED